MTAIHTQRTGFLVAAVFVAGATVYAAVTAGVVQAPTFLFLGMCLLERKRNA